MDLEDRDTKLEKMMAQSTSVDSTYGSANTELSGSSKSQKVGMKNPMPGSCTSLIACKPVPSASSTTKDSCFADNMSEQSAVSTKREQMRHYLRQLRSMVPRKNDGSSYNTLGALKHVVQQMHNTPEVASAASSQRAESPTKKPSPESSEPAMSEPLLVSETDTDLSDLSISTASSNWRLVVSPTGYTVMHASTHMANVLGYTHDYLDNESFFSMMHPQDVPMVSSALMAMMNDRGPGAKPCNLYFRMRVKKALKKGYRLDDEFNGYIPFYGRAGIVANCWQSPTGASSSNNAITSDSSMDETCRQRKLPGGAIESTSKCNYLTLPKDVHPPTQEEQIMDDSEESSKGDSGQGGLDSGETCFTENSWVPTNKTNVVGGKIVKLSKQTVKEKMMIGVTEEDRNSPSSGLGSRVSKDEQETSREKNEGLMIEAEEGSHMIEAGSLDQDQEEFTEQKGMLPGHPVYGDGQILSQEPEGAWLDRADPSPYIRCAGQKYSPSGNSGDSSWITIPPKRKKVSNHERIVIECSIIQSAYTKELDAPTSATFSLRHTVHCKYDNVEPACVSLLGYLPSEILGKPIFDHFHPDDLPMLYHVYKQVVLAPGRMVRCQPYKLRVKNGDSIMVDTEWSSYVNPWTSNLDFVICKHTVLEGPKKMDIFASAPVSAASDDEQERAKHYEEKIKALLLNQRKDGKSLDVEGENGVKTVKRDETSENKALDTKPLREDSDSASSSTLNYDSLLKDKNINILYHRISYTQNIKKFLLMTGGDAMKDPSSKSESTDLEDMDVSLPPPRLQSCASSTKALVSEVEPQEELMMSPNHDHDTIVPELLEGSFEKRAETERSMEMGDIRRAETEKSMDMGESGTKGQVVVKDGGEKALQEEKENDTASSVIEEVKQEERIYKHVTLTKERLQMHQKMQMQIYIEKMIQEKFSVSQYKLHLKRSHITTSSDEAQQCRPQKYQILDHPGTPGQPGNVPTPRPHVERPAFPITAMSLNNRSTTGHQVSSRLPPQINQDTVNIYNSPLVQFSDHRSGPTSMPRMYGYMPYALETQPLLNTWPQKGNSILPQLMDPGHTRGSFGGRASRAAPQRGGRPGLPGQRVAWCQRHMRGKSSTTTDSDSSSMSWLTGSSSNNNPIQHLPHDLPGGGGSKVKLDPPWLQNVMWNGDMQMRYQYPHKEMVQVMKRVRNQLRKHASAHPPTLIKQQLQELANYTSGSGDSPSDEADEQMVHMHCIAQDAPMQESAAAVQAAVEGVVEEKRHQSVSPPMTGGKGSNGSVLSDSNSDSNSNEKSDNGSGSSSWMTLSSNRSGGEVSSSFKESDDMSPSEGSNGERKGQRSSPDYDTDDKNGTAKLFVPVSSTQRRSLQQVPYWLENIGYTQQTEIESLHYTPMPAGPTMPSLRQPDMVMAQLQELISELYCNTSQDGSNQSLTNAGSVAAANAKIASQVQSEKNLAGNSTTGDSGMFSGMSIGGNGSSNNITGTGSSSNSNQTGDSGSDKKSGMSGSGSNDNSVCGGDSEEQKSTGDGSGAEQEGQNSSMQSSAGKSAEGEVVSSKGKGKGKGKSSSSAPKSDSVGGGKNESEGRNKQCGGGEESSSSGGGKFVMPLTAAANVEQPMEQDVESASPQHQQTQQPQESASLSNFRSQTKSEMDLHSQMESGFASSSGSNDTLSTMLQKDNGGNKPKTSPDTYRGTTSMGNSVFGGSSVCTSGGHSSSEVTDQDVEDYFAMFYVYDEEADLSLFCE